MPKYNVLEIYYFMSPYITRKIFKESHYIGSFGKCLNALCLYLDHTMENNSQIRVGRDTTLEDASL